MRILIAVALIGLLGVFWIARAQVVYPTPSPGTGVVTVAGAVAISNVPTVRAAQAGDWTVTLANNLVAVAGPDFVKSPGRYEVIWPNGERETVAVEQVSRDGWVRVSAGRWINLGTARSVEAKP